MSLSNLTAHRQDSFGISSPMSTLALSHSFLHSLPCNLKTSNFFHSDLEFYL